MFFFPFRSRGHRGFFLVVTGSKRFFQTVTAKFYVTMKPLFWRLRWFLNIAHDRMCVQTRPALNNWIRNISQIHIWWYSHRATIENAPHSNASWSMTPLEQIMCITMDYATHVFMSVIFQVTNFKVTHDCVRCSSCVSPTQEYIHTQEHTHTHPHSIACTQHCTHTHTVSQYMT